MKALEIRGLKKRFKHAYAVNGISFDVDEGELFGFLGVNGSGKSTTINTICTLIQPTEGNVKVFGHELGKEDDEIRKMIGVVYQVDCLDELISVRDNLLIRGAMYHKNKKELYQRLEEVTKILSLEELLSRPFGKLSGGQKRRCEIARALMHSPKLLFLDEPTTGLDPATRKVVWNCIEQLRKATQMTVFLTTHYMEEAAKADHIAILDKGQLLEIGTPYQLKEKYVKDQLFLYSCDFDKIENYLKSIGVDYQFNDTSISVGLNQTKDAIRYVEDLKDNLIGFEVKQGTMDDLFLNVTGKGLNE